MKKVNLAILRNESDDYMLWQAACESFSDRINYRIINLTSHDWLEKCLMDDFEIYLLRPPGLTQQFKQFYDERVMLISNILQKPIYPSLTEVLIYENKRFLYSWLKSNNLPHPKTNIFFEKEPALEFAEKTQLPVVIKQNTGGSGAGVKIIYEKYKLKEYLHKVFSPKGTRGRWWPNFERGELLKRGFNYVLHPNEIKDKLNIYKTRHSDVQKGFAIIQEYIKHNFEWRVVAIGESYFAHKKLKVKEKASGSLVKGYENPPLHLFDFAKSIMDRFGFYSQAIDLLENEKGDLLINELQCMFGQSDPYQMLVDGKPGRYRFINNNWVFEEGDFNKNECFDLRLNHALKILNLSK